MKKLLILVLLVPVLALTMISCDADMRSNLAGLMGGFGGNVYADAGLIVVNTAQAEAAAATIAAIGTGAAGTEDVSGGSSTSLGITVAVPGGATSMLAPQTKTQQDELKNNLADAFNSDTQKDKLLEDLKKPVLAGSPQQKAAQGTVAVLNATLDELKAQLGDGNTALGETLEKLKLPEIANGDNLTQGDLLALQLMTDLISNTVGTLTSIGDLDAIDDTALGNSANKDKILSIIDNALFVAEMAENLSGSSSIDFTGQIDLGSLLDGLGDDKGSRSSGDPIELTDAEDFIDTINGLAPSIVKLMGIEYKNNEFTYDASQYRSFLLTQQVYRSSMEQALKMMQMGSYLVKKDFNSLAFDSSTLIKYALAVLITEHHDFWKAKKDGTTPTPGEVLADFLNATEGDKSNKKLGLGTLTKSDVLIMPDDLGAGIDYETWPSFMKTKDLPYYEAIVSNLITINKFGGIAQLTEELEKFRDAASTEDGLTKWYNELE